MLIAWLSVIALGSAALHVRAEYRGPRSHVYLFKPLTTLLILLIALVAASPSATYYKWWIVAGLVFSLAGDVCLMLPGDKFVEGLVSFLLTHLCYAAAFASGAEARLSWAALPFLLYGLVMFLVLAPRLGRLRAPVAVYILAILVMAWLAAERWRQTGEPSALVAFAGAVLFVVSDSALALERFHARYRAAHAVILSTYYAAQWLIALSVVS